MTIKDIKSDMVADGSKWWDDTTMEFFGTEVLNKVYNGAGGGCIL